MGGVVFVIGKDFPEHWERALGAGFWETVSRKDVRRGDLLVFWQASKSLVGIGVATDPTSTASYEIQTRPWVDRDKTTYHHRYRFVQIPGTSSDSLRWSEMVSLLGKPRYGANAAPMTFDESGEKLLERLGLDAGALGLLSEAPSQSLGEALIRDQLSLLRPRLRSDKPYVRADELSTSSVGVVFGKDPEAVDRGLQAHAATQNLAASWLMERGYEVLSPLGGVNFDLAWRQGRRLCVGEVKSLHALNEVHQVRLGIGQVLEFAHRLDAQPVLVFERRPSAEYHLELCESLDIRVAWPKNLEGLVDMDLVE